MKIFWSCQSSRLGRGAAFTGERMGKIDIITSPAGERLVVLPLADYERLIQSSQDALDIADYQAFKAKLASGEEELVPSAVLDRLLAGENPVRVWRETRGMTVKDLAAAAGVSAPYLSQIESGLREGGVATLKKLAAALRLRIDDIV